MSAALSGTETVAFASIVLLAFLRLSTEPAVFTSPLTIDDAGTIVRGWLEQPCAVVVHPTARHLDDLLELLEPLGAGGNLTTDAHLAAIAVEHGATLCSVDADFRRFHGLQTVYLG